MACEFCAGAGCGEKSDKGGPSEIFVRLDSSIYNMYVLLCSYNGEEVC